MTPHRLVNPEHMAPAIGFSHALISCAGRTVFVAGQIAAADDGAVTGTTFVEQLDVALGNVVSALAAAEARPQHVVSMTIFTTAMDEYRAARKEVGVTYRRHFGSHFPPMALLGVTELYEPAASVEIIATAVVPDGNEGT